MRLNSRYISLSSFVVLAAQMKGLKTWYFKADKERRLCLNLWLGHSPSHSLLFPLSLSLPLTDYLGHSRLVRSLSVLSHYLKCWLDLTFSIAPPSSFLLSFSLSFIHKHSLYSFSLSLTLTLTHVNILARSFQSWIRKHSFPFSHFFSHTFSLQNTLSSLPVWADVKVKSCPIISLKITQKVAEAVFS